jgi:hypothetical protein
MNSGSYEDKLSDKSRGGFKQGGARPPPDAPGVANPRSHGASPPPLARGSPGAPFGGLVWCLGAAAPFSRPVHASESRPSFGGGPCFGAILTRRWSGAPKFSLWGPRTGAPCGARGMFWSNEKQRATREAWLCCLLIRARKAATLGCVVVARQQQL